MSAEPIQAAAKENNIRVSLKKHQDTLPPYIFSHDIAFPKIYSLGALGEEVRLPHDSFEIALIYLITHQSF